MTEAVAQRSAASATMLAAAQKGRALMGGTTAMRAARTTYLPQFAKESRAAYDVRLAASWLFNGYRKTVKDMTGRVFCKSVEITEGDERLKEWSENIDMQGRDLSTFARQVFEDALSGPGISYIMVDAPPRKGTVTQAQAQEQNLRPYMVSLRVEDVLGWRAETIANVTTLTQIRIAEKFPERDPLDEFKEVSVDQIRVLDRTETGVQTRLYRRDAKSQKWALEGEPTLNTAIREITIVPFYANRTGFFTGEPMLDDLADINIAHWQSQSDQRNILHYARVPILFGAGMDAKAAITIGATEAVMASDANAKLAWVEHSGAAIGAGRQDLKDLEFQMETFGLQLLTARANAQSATGEALDANKETSQLAMTADALKDALEQALEWMCVYGGFDPEVEVEVNKDFGVSFMTAQEVTALLSAVKDGALSRETFVKELIRRGVLRSDLDPDEEADRIAEDDIAGSDETDPAMMGMAGSTGSNGKSASNADVEFASKMIPHHQAAVDMAKAELANGKDPEMRALAQKVISAQEAEIAKLKAWLPGGM